MKQPHFPTIFLDQTKDLFWMIDLDLQLIYGNKSYLSFIKEMTGAESKLNTPLFIGGFFEGYIEKWKLYYQRAFNGERFQIEQHFYDKALNAIQYSHITFEPLMGDNHKIFAVSCQSKDITSTVNRISEANPLIDASLDVFCTVNEDGNFVYVSGGAINHWGYSPEELIGTSFQNLILEEDMSNTTDIVESLYTGKEVKSFVNRYKKKNGDIAYNMWSARWDETTKLRYAVARDCKEKIEEEDKIQQSEQRFKALVQEGSDLVCILDADGNYTYVSPSSTAVLGIDPEEFIGKNAISFIHPNDVERTLSSLLKIATENKIVVAPFRFQNHEKKWRWVETVLTNMLDNPAVKGIVANSRDITDKIEEEHKLKLLESAITNTRDAILITEAEPFDEPGPKIIYVNAAFTKMTGYDAEEVIGKSPRLLQGPNSNQEELHKLDQAIKKWEPYEMTTINYKKSGEEFWVNFTLTPVKNEKGWYTHWIAIERDVTEQKNRELEKELLAQISENFNTEAGLPNAANALCKSISIFGKFEWVEVWTANLEKNEMQLLSHYVAIPEDEKFYEYSGEVDSFKRHEGLAGKVWSQQSELLWSDIENNKDFIRSNAAKKIQLKAVLGIPLTFNDEVVGVLKIGTKKSASYLNNYIQIFKRLETFIGSELNRKKLENDLSQLFNAIPDIICVFDFQGRFLKINTSGCNLLGYPEADILYHKFEDFVHPEENDVLKNQLKLHKKKESTFKFENRNITSSGEIVWLSWYCNSAYKEGLIYATATDITEGKKLRELNRQAHELAKIGSWDIDLVNQSTYWSDEVHQLHETDIQLFVPNLNDSINFYRPDFRESVQRNIDTCISTGKPFDYEAVLVTAKKKELWIRAIGSGEFVDGACKRIYGSFQDINEQKMATLDLEKSLKTLKDFKFALDQSSIIDFTDHQGIITSVNDNFCNISKYKSEEIVGKTYQLIDSKHHPKEFFEDLWNTIASGKVWRGEIKNKSKDGAYYWVHTTIVPFLDEKNKPFQYLAIRFDITSRKIAEEEKNSLQETLESSLNEIYIFDGKTFEFSYVNQGALLNLGYSENEIKALTPLDLKPDFTASSFNQLVSPLINNEKGKIIFFTNHQRKNGSLYPVEIHLQLVTQGHKKRFLAIVLDITERKKAEESIIQANERFEKVTEATNDAIWDWDIIEHQFYRSKAIEKFFGADASKSFTEDDFWKDKFHPKDLLNLQNSINEALADPLCSRWELEYRVFDENGKMLYVIDRGIIIRNKAGKAIRMVGAMANVTERKHLTLKLSALNESLQRHMSELERSNQELEQFAFVASHDLQEPLRMISSFMDLLQRKYGDSLDEKAHQYIHFATDGAKRMKQIILDLLEFSRATKPTEGKEIVDLNEVLFEFKQLRRKLILEKSAKIKSNTLPILNTYRAVITQILHCLMDNALKYTEDGTLSLVEVNAIENENDYEFSIKDNGIGIDPQFHDKIFIIFQRLHNQDQYAGTGIGLSIAKRHVEFLGGRIWLESSSDNGSTFYFTIPKIK